MTYRDPRCCQQTHHRSPNDTSLCGKWQAICVLGTHLGLVHVRKLPIQTETCAKGRHPRLLCGRSGRNAHSGGLPVSRRQQESRGIARKTAKNRGAGLTGPSSPIQMDAMGTRGSRQPGSAWERGYRVRYPLVSMWRHSSYL
jgi:hypothetical protein